MPITIGTFHSICARLLRDEAKYIGLTRNFAIYDVQDQLDLLKVILKELDIKKNLWFFDCHFKDDPVMPGCLGLDAMWQLVGFYLGWLGNPGRGRALGVNTVKFTGEVLKNVKKAIYEINMKKILKKEGATVGLANGILLADGKQIYTTENLKVGLFK